MYVAATGAVLPPEHRVDAAVAAGLYDVVEARRTAQLAVTVAEAQDSAADFAVGAAAIALRRSQIPASDLALLLNAVLFHSGLDVWNSASYIQRHIAATRSLVAEVRSACDGALVGLELAAAFLATHTSLPAAIITAADVWPGSALDRWRTSSGFVLADGGAAIVLSREPGFAKLVSLATATDPELEGLNRGADRLSVGAHAQHYPIDLNRRAREFLATMPKAEVVRRRDAGLHAAVDQALGEAGIPLDEIRHVVPSFDGRTQLYEHFLTPLGGVDIGRTPWAFARRVGHMGTADPLAALNYLVESNALLPDDTVLLIGVGAGFVWTAAVLQIVDSPPR